MASSHEARLDAEFAKYNASQLISYLRDNPRPRDHYDSISRVLEAREDKAIAVEAQVKFLTGVLRDDDDDTDELGRLPAIAEESASAEIQAALVAPDEAEPSQPHPVQEQEQRLMEKKEGEESLQIVLREEYIPFKKRKRARVVDDDEVVPLPVVKVSASPPSGKAHAVDGNGVGEVVVAPIQILKRPEEETMVATKVAPPPLKKSKLVVVEDDDTLLRPIQILKGLEEEAIVKIQVATPVSEKQDPSDVQPWEPTASCHSQSELISVIAIESKGNALVEEENSESPVSPTTLEENGDKVENCLPREATQEDAEELVHLEIVNQAPTMVTMLVQEGEQEIMQQGKNNEPPVAPTRLEENRERSEIGRPSEATQEEADEPANMEIVNPALTTVLVQQEEQEIMEEQEIPVEVLYPGSDISYSPSGDRTVSKQGRGRGQGGKEKKQTKKKYVGESSRGRGRGRGRGRSTKDEPGQAISSSEGGRGWMLKPETFRKPREDGWLQRLFSSRRDLQRLLTQGGKSSEGGRDHGSTTSSALTVPAGASLTFAEDSSAEWLRPTLVENNFESACEGSMEEVGNAASASSVLSTAALKATNDSGTRNDEGMAVNINGEE